MTATRTGDMGAAPSPRTGMAAGYPGPFTSGPGTVAAHLLDESPRLGWTATTALSPFAGSTSRPSRTRSSVVVHPAHGPVRPPASGAGRIVRARLVVPADVVRHRHVLGGPVGRTGRGWIVGGRRPI